MVSLNPCRHMHTLTPHVTDNDIQETQWPLQHKTKKGCLSSTQRDLDVFVLNFEFVSSILPHYLKYNADHWSEVCTINSSQKETIELINLNFNGSKIRNLFVFQLLFTFQSYFCVWFHKELFKYHLTLCRLQRNKSKLFLWH